MHYVIRHLDYWYRSRLDSGLIGYSTDIKKAIRYPSFDDAKMVWQNDYEIKEIENERQGINNFTNKKQMETP